MFTIANVFAVNPVTKATEDYLQRFVVMADTVTHASGGDTTIPISPAIVTSGAYQSVSVAPANDAAVTVLGTGRAKPVRSTGHGMDKVQDQGFVPSVISQARRRGDKVHQPDGTTRYYDSVNDVEVVFNKAGELVSTNRVSRKKKEK